MPMSHEAINYGDFWRIDRPVGGVDHGNNSRFVSSPAVNVRLTSRRFFTPPEPERHKRPIDGSSGHVLDDGTKKYGEREREREVKISTRMTEGEGGKNRKENRIGR